MLDDEDLDRLYGLPLEEFVAERNALAKRLQRGGDRDAGTAAKRLAKPSVSAWAINQLVRRRRDLVLDLLAAVDRLRAAQLGTLEGRDDAPSMVEATKNERAVLSLIEDAAPEILGEAGYVTSRATVERAMRSIRAAAADDEGRAELEVGRLTADYEPGGFDALAAHAGPQPPPPPPPTDGPRPEPRRARDTIDLEMEAVKREAAIKREEQEERRRLEDSRRQAEEARRALQRKMDAARRTLEGARDAETRIEREHINAQRERKEAERRLEEAQRLTDQVGQRLDGARTEREAAEAEVEALRAELSEA